MATKEPGNEVAVNETGEYPVLFGTDASMLDVISENLGDEGANAFDLDRVTIPLGGGQAWTVPTLEGEDTVKEIEGIIVSWRAPRSYWEVSLDESGGGQPPDCASDDGNYGSGIYGVGSEANPTGECRICPMNQWGSVGGGGNGKACKEQRLLFMVRPNDVLPIAVSLPATSIQPIRKYFLRLAGQATPYYAVVSLLGLERKQSGAFPYSVVVPKVKRVLTDEERKAAKAYVEQTKETLARVRSDIAR